MRPRLPHRSRLRPKCSNFDADLPLACWAVGRRSAIEDEPAQLVAQPLTVEHEFSDLVGKLGTLPPALHATSIATLGSRRTRSPDRVGRGSQLVGRQMAHRCGLARDISLNRTMALYDAAGLTGLKPHLADEAIRAVHTIATQNGDLLRRMGIFPPEIAISSDAVAEPIPRLHRPAAQGQVGARGLTRPQAALAPASAGANISAGEVTPAVTRTKRSIAGWSPAIPARA